MLVGVHAKAIQAPLFCMCLRAGDLAPGIMTGRMLYRLWSGGPLLSAAATVLAVCQRLCVETDATLFPSMLVYMYLHIRVSITAAKAGCR